MPSSSPGLEAFKADAKPGHCPLCDDPVTPNTRGRRRIYCQSPECKSVYQQIYKTDYRSRKARLRGVEVAIRDPLFPKQSKPADDSLCLSGEGWLALSSSEVY